MDKNIVENLIAAYLHSDKRVFEIMSQKTTESYSIWEEVTIRFTKWSALCGMRHYLTISHTTGSVYAN
jgi:hypothetical protein